MKTLSYNCK